MLKLRAMAGLFLLFMFCNIGAHAAADNDKPFADAKVVLQISDMDPSKQELVLNVASNLLKNYGQDRVDIEVVAFNVGLRLLFEDNANAARIKALADSGVRFSACNNTIEGMTKQLGHPPKLNPVAKVVPAGVIQILELVKQGYTNIKP